MTLSHEQHQDEPCQPLRRQRLRIPNACQACRIRKVKCDGSLSTCTKHSRRGVTDDSRRKSSTLTRSMKRKPQSEATIALALSTSPASHSTSRTYALETPPALISQTAPTIKEPADFAEDTKQDQLHTYYAAHGRFAGDVVAAIDEKAGLTPTSTSTSTPFVDAPLYGELDLHSPANAEVVTTDLPRREYADKLIQIYWDYVDPSEPILDRARFAHDYEISYSGASTLLCSDRDVWFSILNAVFALAVQRQESLSLAQRNAEANRYFLRAWVLLRPEVILWKPGTLEMVQCLMLFNRYLHCTNNQEQTWMTAGLAIRMAQNLCCHSPDDNFEDRQLKQKVWTVCLALDRCVSWSLGKTLGPSTVSLSTRPTILPANGSREERKLALKLELHEIGNQIQLAQVQSRNTFAAKLGLPPLDQQNEYHAVTIQLDACLNKWETSLPADWQWERRRQTDNGQPRAELYFLHIRLLVYRIFLYRPMLASFCSSKSRVSRPSSSLSDRIVGEGGRMCIEAAQRITDIVLETLGSDAPYAPLPWWYRICFLHIAATTFLAAMFGPELYTESVAQSWQETISALRQHRHLSHYVGHCIRTFEALSARVLETRLSKPEDERGKVTAKGDYEFSFDAIHDENLQFDDFFVSMDDIIMY